MFAIVVQTMLPFVLAADITAAANATPICHVRTGDDHKNHQPGPAKSCPICAALAATIAAPTPVAPTLPVPRIVLARLTIARRDDAPHVAVFAPYRSRAPPLA